MDKIKNQGNECPIYVVSRKMYMLNKLSWKLEHWLHKFVICMNITKKAAYRSVFFNGHYKSNSFVVEARGGSSTALIPIY